MYSTKYMGHHSHSKRMTPSKLSKMSTSELYEYAEDNDIKLKKDLTKKECVEKIIKKLHLTSARKTEKNTLDLVENNIDYSSYDEVSKLTVNDLRDLLAGTSCPDPLSGKRKDDLIILVNKYMGKKGKKDKKKH